MSAALNPPTGLPWVDTLSQYCVAKAKYAATPDSGPEADMHAEAYCDAMDRLIEQAPSPDLGALLLKVRLAVARADTFEEPLFADHAKGIVADLIRLASVPDSPTRIQAFAAARSDASDRQTAIDERDMNAEGWEAEMSRRASRVWSRYDEGVGSAILSDQPQDLSDVLSVMLIAYERFDRDILMVDDSPTGDVGRACEAQYAALINCIVTLGGLIPPKTGLEDVLLRCVVKERARWMPETAMGVGA